MMSSGLRAQPGALTGRSAVQEAHCIEPLLYLRLVRAQGGGQASVSCMIDNAHGSTLFMELASAPLCLKRFDMRLRWPGPPYGESAPCRKTHVAPRSTRENQ